MTVENANARPAIRVGVIVPERGPGLRDFLERLRCAEHVEVAAIVLTRNSADAPQPRPSGLFRLWKTLDRWLFRQADDSRTFDSNAIPACTIMAAVTDGYGAHNLGTTDLARIRDCKPDVLVQLGPGHFSEGIANCATYGMWSFQYDGYAGVESEIPIFGNLSAGRLTYELVLRAAGGTATPERLLYRGSVQSDVFSLTRNAGVYTRRCAQVLCRCLRQLWEDGWEKLALEDTRNQVLAVPADRQTVSNREMLAFLPRWVTRAALHRLGNFWFREQWRILFERPSESPRSTNQVQGERVSVLAPPQKWNYADPFLVERRGKTYLFFEQYASGGRGTICCAELNPDGTPGEPRQVLARNYHISYPFVFEWQGELYLLPESWENRTVEVYRAVDFPFRWEPAGVLLNDVTAVDPTILEYNGRLWLFVAGIAGLGTECSELSLFFADSLFGKWCAHPKNPVVCDVRRARPAGKLFFEGASLIRPGQDCAERYGHAVTLSRIENLSEADYREVPFATLSPDSMPGVCGTHTLNRACGLKVLDAKVRVPRFASLRRSSYPNRRAVSPARAAQVEWAGSARSFPG